MPMTYLPPPLAWKRGEYVRRYGRRPRCGYGPWGVAPTAFGSAAIFLKSGFF